MSTVDIGNIIKVAPSVVPAQRTASVNGSAVDASGHDGVSFLISTGVAASLTGTNKFTATVESSADGSTGWTGIATDEYIVAKRSDGTAWDRLLDAAGDASASFLIGVRKMDKGFFRLVLTAAAAPDAFVGGSAVLSNGLHQPN